MSYRDLLFSLAVRGDNDLLRTLSRTPLWGEISDLMSNQFFWYERTKYNIAQELTWRQDVNWKTIYYLLKDRENVRRDNLEISDIPESELTVPLLKVLEEAGINLRRNYHILYYAINIGAREVVTYYLENRLIDNIFHYLDHSINVDREDMVRLILSYITEDIDLNSRDRDGDTLLDKAIDYDHPNSVRALVADKRIIVTPDQRRGIRENWPDIEV